MTFIYLFHDNPVHMNMHFLSPVINYKVFGFICISMYICKCMHVYVCVSVYLSSHSSNIVVKWYEWQEQCFFINYSLAVVVSHRYISQAQFILLHFDLLHLVDAVFFTKSTCIKQDYQHNFPTTFTYFMPVSHFGNFLNILNF